MKISILWNGFYLLTVKWEEGQKLRKSVFFLAFWATVTRYKTLRIIGLSSDGWGEKILLIGDKNWRVNYLKKELSTYHNVKERKNISTNESFYINIIGRFQSILKTIWRLYF